MAVLELLLKYGVYTFSIWSGLAGSVAGSQIRLWREIKSSQQQAVLKVQLGSNSSINYKDNRDKSANKSSRLYCMSFAVRQQVLNNIFSS